MAAICMTSSAPAHLLLSNSIHLSKNEAHLSSRQSISSKFFLTAKQPLYSVRPPRRPLSVTSMAPPKPGGKPKKVTGVIKLALEAGKATPSPPVGPALGSKGVNIMAFCKDYNARTADKAGYVIPVEITVYDDRSFTFILKTPPAPVLLLKAAVERVVILVIGGGGREHALCYALNRSPSCDAVFCAPGNVGISNSGDATCISSSNLDIRDSSAVIAFCRQWGVGLVVVGPEAPLVAGLANDLVKAGIPTFGPSSEAAALEGSKNFMKTICDKYGIPTAKYKTFSDPFAAKEYIKDQGFPVVIKADGLAAGKGVIVAMTLEEAYEAVDSMLVKGDFGSAGGRIIVEEYLEGEEASFFALVDGENAIPLESAQDHKRVGDGDTGPNTGGMGAYSHAPVLTKELQSLVMDSIILPTVKGMTKEGRKFIGVLYAGLMIEKRSGLPKLIEYNVRFGDPECQVLMVRLESDLAQVLLAACRGKLNDISLEWSPGSAMVVVMASKGYPGSYEKRTIIQNLEEAEQVAPSVKIFHAGTDLDEDGNFIAVGGRVLGVTAKGKDLEEARDRAYQAIEQINWTGGFFRRDIGWRALSQNHYFRKG